MVSFSGAPGTTTVALATAAALTTTGVAEPVLVELPSSGGVVAGWYELPAEPGLSSLALAIGNDSLDLLAHAQELPGGLPAVVAPPSGSRVAKLLAAKGMALASFLRDVEATVVVDAGRISVDTPARPLLEASSLVGVVVRPNREDFRLAATTLAELNTVAQTPLPAGWVLVGESPWSIGDISSQYGLPVLATIADDPGGAEAVAGRRRLRRHAPLARSVQSFADDIAKHLRVASPDDPLAYLNAEPSPPVVSPPMVSTPAPTSAPTPPERPEDDRPAEPTNGSAVAADPSDGAPDPMVGQRQGERS